MRQNSVSFNDEGKTICRSFVTVLMCILLISGCAANSNSIFRKAYTAESSILVDAKQRLILTSKTPTPAPNKTKDRLILACAEPSPDVFSTLASSIGASGTYTTGEKDIVLQYARSLAESGVDIGLRTQTIQVLRDMMYRLCERYFNGAISTVEFEQQAARDQRLIVAVLAIEQLTGAVRPSRAGTVAISRNDMGAGLLDAQKLLNEAVELKNSAEKENNTATENLTAAQTKAATAKSTSTASTTTFESVKNLVPALKTAADTSNADYLEKEKAFKAAETAAKAEPPGETKLKNELATATTARDQAKTTSETDAKALKDANTNIQALQTKATKDAQELQELENSLGELQKAAEDANQKLANSIENVAVLEKARDAANKSVSDSSVSISYENRNDGASVISKDTVKVLSTAVTDIVNSTFDDDEFARTCLTLMKELATQVREGTARLINATEPEKETFDLQKITSSNFQELCAGYINSRAEERNTIRQLEAIAQIQNTSIPEDVWRKILDPDDLQ